MKITGIQLQHAITARKEIRDLLQSEFNGSLSKFECEEKRDPVEIANELDRVEREIAALQAVQGLYNTQVKVTVGDQTITLLQAVKSVGGANRIANIWKDVVGTNTRSLSRRGRYDAYSGPQFRDKDQEYAKETITVQQAGELARAASKQARAIQAAIAYGNAQSVEIEVREDLLGS
jgi:hypothetical protein